ncbi:MAG: hypothetical protein WD883_00460 [Candidatus Colwellbacteria bacterium]
MTESEFAQAKGKIVELAEQSIFFYGFPGRLAELREKVSTLEQSEVAEHVLVQAIDFFEKTNKEIPENIDLASRGLIEEE